jgi:hypothetical protein
MHIQLLSIDLCGNWTPQLPTTIQACCTHVKHT